jgi:acetylglutamate kinase
MTHLHAEMKTLRTAIPYIRAYEGRVFVVKLGGSLCDPGPVLENVVEQLSLLATLGIRVVVVHGGGEQMNALCRQMGVEPQVVAGRRITDERTLELAKMTFAGTINTNLVAAFRKSDVPAVGLTGVDARLITVVKRPPQQISDPETGQSRTVDFGLVGNIVDARMEAIEHLLDRKFVPVVASLAADGVGRVYNVNADTVAARIAVELRAVKYFLLTTVDGVMRDVNDPSTLQSYLDVEQLNELIGSGAVRGGMLPKLAACSEALQGGVPRVHIVNGTTRDSLLAEVFTNEGCGTMLVARRENARPATQEAIAT